MKGAKTKTDWESYYTRPKSRVSTFTQNYTLHYLVEKFKLIEREMPFKVMECGGGNSCFAESLTKKLRVFQYDIIDNCYYAVKQVRNKIIDNAYYMDLLVELEKKELVEAYDIVYSVGLVEHFTDSERKRVIENHFRLCKKGGYVLITSPTPTVQYRFSRLCMEAVHMWQFWDEQPIRMEILKNEMEYYGKIVDAGINRKLPLTQAVVLVKKNGNE